MTEARGNSAAALSRLRDRLKQLAARGEDRLPPERALAEGLSVGRRSVRRALEVLEAEGRIWRHQGKGTFIGSRPGGRDPIVQALSTRATFDEVMETRLRLEPQLAHLAAQNATDEQVAAMRRVAAHIAGCADADARELWDGSLHRLIARAAGNRLLLGFFDVIDRIRQDDAWTCLRERARGGAGQGRAIRHHDAIIAAIAARDPAGAEAAMRRHIVALQQSLIAASEGETRAAE